MQQQPLGETDQRKHQETEICHLEETSEKRKEDEPVVDIISRVNFRKTSSSYYMEMVEIKKNLIIFQKFIDTSWIPCKFHGTEYQVELMFFFHQQCGCVLYPRECRILSRVCNTKYVAIEFYLSNQCGIFQEKLRIFPWNEQDDCDLFCNESNIIAQLEDMEL
jgi:hypothetical protein